MDQTSLVGVMDSIADSCHQFEPLASGKPMLVGIFTQRNPANKLHREIWLQMRGDLGGSRFVDLCDPGMLQAPERLGFLFEPPELFPTDQCLIDELEGNCP